MNYSNTNQVIEVQGDAGKLGNSAIAENSPTIVHNRGILKELNMNETDLLASIQM